MGRQPDGPLPWAKENLSDMTFLLLAYVTTGIFLSEVAVKSKIFTRMQSTTYYRQRKTRIETPSRNKFRGTYFSSPQV